MLKRVIIATVCSVAVLIVVFYVYLPLSGIPFGGTPEPITELNQTYEGPLLSMTALDIRAVRRSSPLSAEDAIVVGVMFRIENISDKRIGVRSYLIDEYVDDVAVSSTNDPAFEPQFIHANLVPGKHTEGYYCVEAPQGAKSIELHIGGSTPQGIFRLAIPPVEDAEP